MEGIADQSNRESVNAAEEHKKEQEDPQENTTNAEQEQDDRGEIEQNVVVRPSTEKQVIAAQTLFNFKRKHVRTMLQLWHHSNLKEFEDPKMKEVERRKNEGHLIIKDVNEDGSFEKKKQKKENKNSSDFSISRKGKEKVYEPELINEPLGLMNFIAIGFSVYVEHITEMRKQRRRGEETWIFHLEEGADILDAIMVKMQLMNEEMRRMKRRKDLREDYVRFHKMLSELEEISGRLDESPNIGILYERDCTEEEWWACESELEQCQNIVERLENEVENLTTVIGTILPISC